MLPRTRETPTQGEASRDGILIAHKQNEFEQQVGLVSFTTDLRRMQTLCWPDCSEVHSQTSPSEQQDMLPSLTLFQSPY